ncbi:MAG: protoporphyrinogen oxidase [Deltaproteobacteria bacterium]|nr:protoporphyrinogen oxidase [Deltaproteobacteria bacterium]
MLEKTDIHDFIIIGGGLAGMAALAKIAAEGKSVLCLEKEPRVGGLVATDFKDGYLLDIGPTVFLKSYEHIWKLLDEIGLRDEVLFNDTKSTARYLYRNGAIHPVPENPLALIKTPLLSASVKLRLFAEPFIGRGNNIQETVREFGNRRFGKELTDHFLDAMVSGMCAGDISKLEVGSLFPKLADIEKEYRSLLIFLMKFKKQNVSNQPKTAKGIRFASFLKGMGRISEKIRELYPHSVVTGSTVQEVSKANGFYRVATTTGVYQSKRLVFATPAYIAANLIAPIAPDISNALQNISYTDIATLSLGYDRKQVGHSLEGFGFLVPRGAGVRLLGTMFSSSIFPGRSPEGKVLTTIYIGGEHDREALKISEAQLREVVNKELGSILSISGEPEFCFVRRINNAIPQLNVGHGKIKQQIFEILEQEPTINLVGNYLGGISVNEAIKSREAIKL